MITILNILLGILLAVPSFSQDLNPFSGEWKVEQSNDNSEWLLKKPIDTTEFRNWGTYFSFNQDGTFTQKASAPCGLDDNRYNYEGKWNYDKKTKSINLTEIKVINPRPNIYQNYKVLTYGSIEILSILDNTLKIRVVNNWEKVSKKK
jgi:hypothetical protein